MDKPDILNEESYREIEEIKKSPYDYICSFYEKVYPHMGGEVMKILSLVPCSLIIPSMEDEESGKKTSSRISFLLLSPSGTAKTELSSRFKEFCYEPFPFEYITDSKLSSVLDEKEYVTVITSDISRIFRDPILSKLMENIIGDEGKLSRFTQKSKDTEEKLINAVGYFSGTPVNLSKTITDGLIFRVSPCIIFPTAKHHESTLKEINNRIATGNGKKSANFGQKIKEYYELVLKEAEKIESYSIPLYFREEIESKLFPYFKKSYKDTDFTYYRELNQCYRYIISHATLNIFNRKIMDGKLILEDLDLRVAMKLTENELKTKVSLIKCMNIISENKIKNLNQLNKWASIKIKEDGNFLTRKEYLILKHIMRAK